MSSREQFEAAFPVPSNIRWSDEHQSYGFIRRKGNDISQVHRYRSMWNAWQASRQALVVELPPSIPMPDEENDDIEEFETEEAIAFTGNGMRAACRSAIEAAGVRVKE